MKYFIFATVALFSLLGILGWLKKEPKKAEEIVQEIPLAKPASPSQTAANAVINLTPPQNKASASLIDEKLPEADQVERLFALDDSKLPIVETVSFTSRVPWLKGRPAWIADYASHFETSRHFIARSLNRKLDYFTQKVSPGDRFNVFKKDLDLTFHLVVDLTRCKMWFYYIDKGTNERVLLKSYRIGVGRLDSQKASGSATPLGKYAIGDKVAVYKPGTMGFYQDKKVEMVQVFGTRWIPLEKAIDGASESPKGLGLHGAPCSVDPSTGACSEDLSKIGKQETDGGILLSSEDLEELFAILITKPTVVEIVKDFHQAQPPGRETELSSRSAP